MSGPPPDPNRDAVTAHYDRGAEQDRLAQPRGVIEFLRTKEILGRHLPPAPATIADIGGGPGRYSLWLAQQGYQVVHRDLVPLHVQQLAEAVDGRTDLRVETGIGDACQLDLRDQSVEAVLLLGPIYHLPERQARLRALVEARCIVRPGGHVFVAAISRWAARLDAIIGQRVYEEAPEVMAEIGPLERTGVIRPLGPGSFTAYAHRPLQLRAEIRAAGLQVISLVGVEAVHFLLADLPDRVENPDALAVLLESARALESVPEVLGVSPHFLATAIRVD